MLLHSIHTRKFGFERESASPVTNLTARHCKKYIFNTANQGKRKLLKNPKSKNYIEYSEKFQGKLCFSFTVLNMYFLSFRILNNLRLP